MTSVCREIFKAIHEGKWLSIEYKNQTGKITKYWIGIKSLNLRDLSLIVDGLHLGELKVQQLKIFIKSILNAAIVEGSYCEVNRILVEDIKLNPTKYAGVFDQIPNLKILNYLVDCNRLDATPYSCEYKLIHCFDADRFENGKYQLDDDQFAEIVRAFQYQTNSEDGKIRVKQLGLNAISVPVRQGLYVLAYHKLHLDVANRMMRVDEDITFCREFTIEGDKLSIRQFLEPYDMDLLDDPHANLETIKDYITLNNPNLRGVDDMPYVIAIAMDYALDLEHEYSAIMDMYQEEKVTAPIRAFFGEYLKRPVRRKQYPLALLNRKVNLDQLLAINNAMRYPLAYIQGPPGTGKTNTIMNTIMTAFFNDRTVLFASNNNHPIDEVYKKMRQLRYQGRPIPFPMIRLGNIEVVKKALNEMRTLYEQVKNVNVYDSTLDKRKGQEVQRTAQLTKLLEEYYEILDLKERREVTQHLLEENDQFNFQFELRGRQLAEIDQRLAEIGDITDADALNLLEENEKDYLLYLNFTSVKHIKRIGEPKNKELFDIIYMDADDPERVNRFNQYLSKPENVRLFQRIFPIIATTCISAHRIGDPEVYFDMVIMDEASQCNTAVSLVPILRGESLMLVGDPQQLQPVILLNEADNQTLRKKYAVAPEYDYIANSVYKTFLACDPVSDEVLLHHHYRCHPKIIGFNNKKYYNGKLVIESNVECKTPLTFVDVEESDAVIKNTSPGEAEQIINYVRAYPGKNIGIITPFANQKMLISDELAKIGRRDVACGTVHAFQGDEKDVILFSLGLSDVTQIKTYDWLKNNRELINVATSRARQELIVLGSSKNLDRLHSKSDQDDLYELVDYIRSNGMSQVSQRTALSRALGIKPYSTETEAAFMENLNHAIDNIQPSGSRYSVHKEVPVAQVFVDNPSYADLFYTGRFDFVVYERGPAKTEFPVLAIELDGKEHFEDEIVKERDRKKNQICKEHDFELIRVENTYARRYHYIKDILIRYFTNGRAS